MARDEQGMRQDKRDSLFLRASLSIAGEPAIDVRVRNLSAGGMMVDVELDVTTGEPIEAEMRGIGRVKGRIAWSTPGRAGIAFDNEIDPRKARSQLAPQPSSTPSYLKIASGRRPGLGVR